MEIKEDFGELMEGISWIPGERQEGDISGMIHSMDEMQRRSTRDRILYLHEKVLRLAGQRHGA